MKSGEERTVYCRMCGKPFTARSNSAKYCPTCKAAKRKADQEIANLRRNEARREMRAAKSRECAKPKGLTLAETAVKAKELHMTYGEYVARFGG